MCRTDVSCTKEAGFKRSHVGPQAKFLLSAHPILMARDLPRTLPSQNFVFAKEVRAGTYAGPLLPPAATVRARRAIPFRKIPPTAAVINAHIRSADVGIRLATICFSSYVVVLVAVISEFLGSSSFFHYHPPGRCASKRSLPNACALIIAPCFCDTLLFSRASNPSISLYRSLLLPLDFSYPGTSCLCGPSSCSLSLQPPPIGRLSHLPTLTPISLLQGGGRKDVQSLHVCACTSVLLQARRTDLTFFPPSLCKRCRSGEDV